ncbi:MAG: hypothetical protein ACRC80_38275 [Waterburya sp.]
MTQNSAPDNCLRPDELMEELGIKKDAYYKDLSYLEITPEKDSEGKCYLTIEQADKIRALRNHVNETGKRNGFDNNSIVRVDDSNELVSNSSEAENDIYINREEPTAQFNLERLMRDAAELKARELAMPNLVKREIANRMSEEDLPDDLKEKVAIAREVANPKWTPGQLADNLLSQYRSQRNN